MTDARSDSHDGWRDIASAPTDGTIFDVYFADPTDEELVTFYCTPGTRRSPAWHYRQMKFRPYLTLGVPIVSIQPTHWQPLPQPPVSVPSAPRAQPEETPE